MKNYKEIKQLAEEAKKKEKEEKKFCRLCQKPETRDECSYGEKAWDRFAVPVQSIKREEVELDEAAWTRKEGQNKNGGLNEKGRKSYERANPGSDLKAPSKKNWKSPQGVILLTYEGHEREANFQENC